MERKTANDVVTLARAQDRLTTLEYIEAILEGFLRSHGDRYFANDLAVVGGVATLQGRPVTVAGIRKGRNLSENIERNFGSPNPEGYRKALCLVERAEKFNRPVITFMNTTGAYCEVDVEERGEGEAIVQDLSEMSDLKVLIISIIIGEGGNGGALASAVADGVWVLEHAIYTVLSPEGFASILWKNGSHVKETAELMKITATELKELAVVNKVTPEIVNGQPLEQAKINRMLRKVLILKLTKLAKLGTEALLEKRYQRFRKY